MNKLSVVHLLVMDKNDKCFALDDYACQIYLPFEFQLKVDFIKCILPCLFILNMSFLKHYVKWNGEQGLHFYDNHTLYQQICDYRPTI